MGGWGSGNIPDFSREAAAKSGKAPDGRRYGAGERGATYRLAPLPRGGAAFGHTSAEASAAALSRRRGRSPPSHSAASDHRLTSLSPGMSGSKDRKDWLPLCRDSPVGPPPAAADNGPSVNLRSSRPFGDCKTHCNPKRVCKIGDSCRPPAASAAGVIPGQCLRNLVISRRQYGTSCRLSPNDVGCLSCRGVGCSVR